MSNWLDDLDALYEKTGAAPRGTYGAIPAKTKVKVKVVEQKFFYSSQKSTPGVKVVLEVGEGDYVGKRIWHDFWMTEKNLQYLKRDLATLGYTGKLSALAEEASTDLIGLGAEVTVEVEEYEAQNKETGQTEKREKNKVAFWNSVWHPPQEEPAPNFDEPGDIEVPF